VGQNALWLGSHIDASIVRFCVLALVLVCGWLDDTGWDIARIRDIGSKTRRHVGSSWCDYDQFRLTLKTETVQGKFHHIFVFQV
jgi:hypothetical protein